MIVLFVVQIDVLLSLLRETEKEKEEKNEIFKGFT